METKFTKGKWEANPFNCNDLQVWSKDSKIADCSNQIQSTLYRTKELDEMKANALLISKAPEMFEMLEEVVKKLKGNGFPMLTGKIEQLLKEATEL